MRGLESPVLPPAVVAKLVGVSVRTLARWRALGIGPAPQGAGPGAAARYSWLQVEQFQRLAHLARPRRLRASEVRRLLAAQPAGAGRAAAGRRRRAGRAGAQR